MTDTRNAELAVCGDAAGCCCCAVEMPNWDLTHPVSGSAAVTTDPPIQSVPPGNPCLFVFRAKKRLAQIQESHSAERRPLKAASYFLNAACLGWLNQDAPPLL